MIYSDLITVIRSVGTPFYQLFFLSQIHLMTFQGTRYCAKDPTLVNPDEIKAARGELEPPIFKHK